MKKERATSRESQGGMLKKLSLLLLFSILTVMLLMPVSANAAPKLNKKTARIYVGKTVKLKVSGKKRKTEMEISKLFHRVCFFIRCGERKETRKDNDHSKSRFKEIKMYCSGKARFNC